MRVILVRHGQSSWNASHKLQGQANIGLSDHGCTQADRLAPVIKSIGVSCTISSDLDRARETARRIGAPDPIFTEQLREIDVGEWTGRSIEEIKGNDLEGYLGWRAGTTTPPGGEAWADFATRVCNVIVKCQEKPCENLLVVCHGGVIRAILQGFLGLAPANIIPVGPASLTAIRFDRANKIPARLELFNYLPDRFEFEAPD